MPTHNYSFNVFINCPYDDGYQRNFHSIVYTLFRCGLIPHCALEHDDASENRIDKIYRIIRGCKFGIHDISNTHLNGSDKLPRFNMPFELGVFLAAKKFGTKEQRHKSILIFEKTKFLSKIYLSDLNGADSKAHEGDCKTIIRHIRTWLLNSGLSNLPGHIILQHEFDHFYDAFLPLSMQNAGLELSDLSFNDYCTFLQDWLIEYAK